jgi:hypothetical protein
MATVSLRKQVFQYIMDHPSLLKLDKKGQNIELCEAFGAIGENEQNIIKQYKAQYFSELEFAKFEAEHPELQISKKDIVINKNKKKKVKPSSKLIPWDKKVKCSHCPGVYANEVMKFVGFRGSIDPNGICHLDMKGSEHQGEAWPPPIIPVSNINRDNLIRLTGRGRRELGSRFFLGILKYEVEIMTLIFMLRGMGYENIALLMPRGHGKTYIFDWDDQIGLKHFSNNYMMLSETNARKKVGNWVYVWALRNEYLKDPEKFARKSTYQHFEMLNGNRMDIYKFSEEDLVGEHDYILKLDDCVKRKWRERPTENQKMIDHWQSNINFIIRSGLEIAGTRKFEGDVIEHIIDTIEDIVVIKMSPFIECPHDNLNTDGTYDACEICQDLALLAPEIHSYDSLMKKMYEDFEAWYAEMMQNPHPMEGGMVDEKDIQYTNRPFWKDVQMICISVDSTEADLESTDMCGIVGTAMLKDTKLPEFIVLDADVRKMPFHTTTDIKGEIHRGIMETIELFVRNYVINFPNVPIIIAIETQGGGLFIIKEAREYHLSWFNFIISEKDKIQKGYHDAPKYGIRHSKEKVARVFSELRYPIKEGQVKFDHGLFGSVLIRQICTFPKGKYDDGVDSCGMGKDELLKRWYPPGKFRKTRDMKKQEKDQTKHAKAFRETMMEPWRVHQRKKSRRFM